MTGTVHVIGAGLAGLSAAVRLTEAGKKVVLWEATGQAGGRCRTFWDPRLSRDVDNGNHLVLSGNRSVRDYLATIGATDLMQTASAARFEFADLKSGERWHVQMNDGRIPLWVLGQNRISGTRLSDYLSAWRLAAAGPNRSVAEVIRTRGALWQRFWEPLTLAVLNTTPERGSAQLLWRAMRETFARGGKYCRPMFAPKGLGRALIDPAVNWLDRRDVRTNFDHALKSIERAGDRVVALTFSNGLWLELSTEDRVILALPPTRLKSVLPDIEVPEDRAAILNAHFTVPAELVSDCAPITGLVNARTHWVFVRGDVVSLTISAADRLGVMEMAPEDLIPELWAEVTTVLDLGDAKYIAARINKERRATFDQSPAGVGQRPNARTSITNLWLAGDCTQTGLPATIEGAVRSGVTAAHLAAWG